MPARPAISSSAFTLLESLVALTILAMVAAACLELRANALNHTSSLAGRQDTARLAHTIYDLAFAGLLPAPVRADPEDTESPLVWTGQRDAVSYRLTREPIELQNPITAPRRTNSEDQPSKFPQRVALYRYTLELEGQTFTLEHTQ